MGPKMKLFIHTSRIEAKNNEPPGPLVVRFVSILLDSEDHRLRMWDSPTLLNPSFPMESLNINVTNMGLKIQLLNPTSNTQIKKNVPPVYTHSCNVRGCVTGLEK